MRLKNESHAIVTKKAPKNRCRLVAKESGTCEKVKFKKPSNTFKNNKRCIPVPPSRAETEAQTRDEYLGLQKNTVVQESHFVSSRSLKRGSPFSPSNVEPYPGNCWKRRVLDEQRGKCGVVSGHLRSLTNKVDVGYPHKNLGEICMHNDSSSVASSVGSCSVVSNSLSKLRSHILAVPSQEADMLSSDAESFCGRGDEEEEFTYIPPKGDVSVEVHRLELHAYRCTLQALFASGPLSWEREAMLTNLRSSLHISNDEHLMELRDLISGGINARKI